MSTHLFAANNWPYRVDVPFVSGFTPLALITAEPVWDPFSKRWLLAGEDSNGVNDLFGIHDLGNRQTDYDLPRFGNGQAVFGAADPTCAVAVTPTGRVWTFNATNGRFRADIDGNFTFVGTGGFVTAPSRVHWLDSANGLVTAHGNPSGPSAVYYYSNSDGSTFTNGSAQIPAEVAGDISWVSAVSSNLFVAFSTTANRTKYVTTVNGSTLTTQTLTGVVSGDATTDVIWSSYMGSFVRSVVNGNDTKIYRSHDGVTWFQTGTITGHTVRRLAALGPVLLGLSNRAPANTNSPFNARMLYSTDSGEHWTINPFSGLQDSKLALVSNDHQVVTIGRRTMHGSLVINGVG